MEGNIWCPSIAWAYWVIKKKPTSRNAFDLCRYWDVTRKPSGWITRAFVPTRSGLHHVSNLTLFPSFPFIKTPLNPFNNLFTKSIYHRKTSSSIIPLNSNLVFCFSISTSTPSHICSLIPIEQHSSTHHPHHSIVAIQPQCNAPYHSPCQYLLVPSTVQHYPITAGPAAMESGFPKNSLFGILHRGHARMSHISRVFSVHYTYTKYLFLFLGTSCYPTVR